MRKTTKIIVIGTPIAKPRMTRSDKWRRPPRRCVLRYIVWKNTIRFTLLELQERPDELHQGPVRIEINYHLPVRKGSTAIPHTDKPDIDNLNKSILESLTGYAYEDDRQVYDISATKVICDKKEEPRAEIRITLI